MGEEGVAAFYFRRQKVWNVFSLYLFFSCVKQTRNIKSGDFFSFKSFVHFTHEKKNIRDVFVIFFFHLVSHMKIIYSDQLMKKFFSLVFSPKNIFLLKMFHSLEFHKWISFSYLKKLRKNYFYRMNNHFSCIKLISRFFLPPKLLWFCFFSPGVKLTGQIKSSSFFPPKFLPTQISHIKKIWWSCLKPAEIFFLNKKTKKFLSTFFFHSKFHTWKKIK